MDKFKKSKNPPAPKFPQAPEINRKFPRNSGIMNYHHHLENELST